MFDWNWKLSDGYPKKNGLKVFTTFAAGGGSSMGYKLAGFDVIGFNELDPKMAEVYQVNHKPKHSYIEDIKIFNKRKDLPKELFDLDILDGSPPCSVFSISGNRDKDWQVEKKFREGQVRQVLDDLFFDFSKTVGILKPKVFVAENVKGLLMGHAKWYLKLIRDDLHRKGYQVQVYLLNSATMGVPQRRERVFLIGLRNDLDLPKLKLEFKEKPIFFKEIKTDEGIRPKLPNYLKPLIDKRLPGDNTFARIKKRVSNKESYFNAVLIQDNKVPNTIVSGSSYTRYSDGKVLSDIELARIMTYPSDFNYIKNTYNFKKYVLGMSVAPVMMANIAYQIKKQWFDIMQI